MGEARMNRRKIASLALVLGLIATLVAAMAGTAAGQEAQAQLAAVNGSSTDPVDVTANAVTIAAGLEFVEAAEGVLVAPGDYTVAFSGSEVAQATLAAGTAGTVVSGFGLGDDVATVYPVDVSEIPGGGAVAVVWNATADTVLISVNGSDPFELLAGEGVPQEATVGADFTVQVGDVTRSVTLAADNYVDAFVVSDGTTTDVAFAVVPSMTALIEALAGTQPPEPEPDPTVPDVAGQSAVDATAALVGAGFDVAETDEPSDDVPAGVAIGTEPPAGTQLAAGSTVALLISTGPATIAVPDVVGQVSDDAIATLDDAGFTTSSEEQPSDDVEEGLVISTNPRAGTEVAPGSEVVVVVSTGPEPVDLPDFTSDEHVPAVGGTPQIGVDVGQHDGASLTLPVEGGQQRRATVEAGAGDVPPQLHGATAIRLEGRPPLDDEFGAQRHRRVGLVGAERALSGSGRRQPVADLEQERPCGCSRRGGRPTGSHQRLRQAVARRGHRPAAALLHQR